MTNNSLQIAIASLTEEHLSEIIALQDKVTEVLEKPEFLQPLTEEEFLYILHGNGMMAGAFVDGQLIAFRAMLDPGDDDEHLGLDVDISQQELSIVLYSEISNVHPEFRGNGLQIVLGEWLLRRLDRKQYRYICSTVAPLNIPSLKDKFVLGMHIAALKNKYGNKLRYIFCKDVDVPFQSEAVSQVRTVLMRDIAQQQQLLTNGWLGIRIEQQHEEWYVVYVK
ncbi:GNAT family N-acetyltransferase [Sporosarcina obsidiansis]|uniref:GNAT family N-acetyltransferase n=1 Tax=Sporosarcina obsidiansis TaxID=2660748 RepID=UPI00129C019F|nr:GNAT family N-acetyltransferase [Sporosarcina obsidiansis]